MGRERIDWTHPSYRDLVIEELRNDTSLQHEFLRKMSFSGIKLAISDSGGTVGDRNFPLMTSPESWELLQKRCVELVDEGSAWKLADLLNALSSAAMQVSERDSKDFLTSVITVLCKEVRNKWNQLEIALTASQLSAYSQASLLVSPLPPLPNLRNSWLVAEKKMHEELKENKRLKYVAEHDHLESLVELAKVIQKNEPRFLRQNEFPEMYNREIEGVLDLMESEVQEWSIPDSSYGMVSEAERLYFLAEIFADLEVLIPKYRDQFERLTNELQRQASALEEEARDLEDPETEENPAPAGNWRDKLFDKFFIERLFSDL